MVVVLHIGAPKSGTTALQSRLQAHHAVLADARVCVPRAPAADGETTLAFRAALDLTGVHLGRGPEYAAGWWSRLVDAVAGQSHAVVSHEAFVRADDAAAARAVGELGGPARVRVVYTARDLGRGLTSTWLEGLKHGTTRTYAEHAAAARAGSLPVMRGLDLPAVVGRWADHAPVTVVTVPPEGADRSLLWTRFAQACGLDPALAPGEPARENRAVGVAQAQVLRLLHVHLDGRSARGRGLHAVVRDVVAERALAGGERVRPAPHDVAWLTERAAEHTAWLAAPGTRFPVDVVGDPADLRPAAIDPAGWTDPDEPTPAVLDAAVHALAVLVRELRRARRRAED
ncbi:hypothetical protein [Nocardioides sp.]|uniref:hypothetical protein n=1 Tax=Nocardioides sp. TaxID=35761 RepID=UPI003516C230